MIHRPEDTGGGGHTVQSPHSFHTSASTQLSRNICTLSARPHRHLHSLLMQQLYRASNEKKSEGKKNHEEDTKLVDYELNSIHQTAEQQASNIPTVRSFLPAFRATFSLISPKVGKCNEERSHICSVMLRQALWNSKLNSNR